MLFRMVSTTDKFFEFIEENKFYGEKGIAAFEDWLPLITQILQGEQFKQHVLNDLITGTQIADSRINWSTAQKYIEPFVLAKNQQILFMNLMSKVKSLKIERAEHLNCFITMKENMDLIQYWFEQAKPGKIGENVIKVVEKILKEGNSIYIMSYWHSQGVYNIVLQSWLPKVVTKQLKASDTLDNLSQIKGTHYEIKYILSKEEDLVSTLTPEAAEELIRKVILCLTGTQFIYVATHLDKTKIKSMICSINLLLFTDALWKYMRVWFTCFMVITLLAVLQQLESMGHPLYQNRIETITPAAVDLTSLTGFCLLKWRFNDKLASLNAFKTELDEWQTNLNRIRKDSALLLFFSIKQVISMMNIIHSRNAQALHSYISMLFPNQKVLLLQLQNAIDRLTIR